MHRIGKIRVLQVLSTAKLAGTELMTHRLVANLNRNLFEPHVLILDSDGPIAERFRKEQVPVQVLGFSYSGIPKLIMRLVTLLRRNSYDVIHTYGLRASILFRILGCLLGHRNILNGLRDSRPSPGKISAGIQLALDKLTFPFARYYVSNSKDAIAFWVSKGFAREKFKLISNGLDMSSFEAKYERAEVVKEFGLRMDSRLVIICVANLTPKKGHRDLIEALARLKDSGHEFLCVLVGEGPLRRDLEILCRSRSLDDRVWFLGRQQEIPKLLSLADIFVLPSLWEGQPGAVMEAMASHLPVVATNVHGTREIVLDGITGLLVSPRNPKELAGKLGHLLQDSDRRRQMGACGYRRIKEHFSLEEMVRATEQLYLALAPQ